MADSGEVQNRRRIGDNDQGWSGLVESLEVFTKLLNSIMDRNLALCQHRLKLQLAHFGQTAGLRKSQPRLLEKCYRELPLQLQLVI
jgi:hypothetical protein